MRILVLSDEIFPDAVSGIGKSVANELNALARRGHQITVVVRSLRSDLTAQEQLGDLHIHRVKGPLRASPLYFLYPIVLLFKLLRFLRTHAAHYDVLVSHNPIYLFAAHLVGLTKQTPAVVMFHASIAQEINIHATRGKYGYATLLAKGAARVLNLVERWTMRRATAIVAHSAFMHRSAEALINHPVPIYIIPIGLNVQTYTHVDAQNARLRLGLPHDRKILITVRRLVARVGVENLIIAMQQVITHQPDALLLIAGTGYLHDTLLQKITHYSLTDNVQLLGFVAEDALPMYLAAADLFVLPTEQLEGFGLATIEALAVGLPVVGTPVGATPEILQQVHPELLTPDASPAAIASTLIRWLNDDKTRETLRQKSRQTVEERYDANVVAEQLETVLMNIAATKAI